VDIADKELSHTGKNTENPLMGQLLLCTGRHRTWRNSAGSERACESGNSWH